jgi:hypothetical protein
MGVSSASRHEGGRRLFSTQIEYREVVDTLQHSVAAGLQEFDAFEVEIETEELGDRLQLFP